MRKKIILCALMIGALSYAQNNEFAKYATNTELVKAKNTVKPEEKKEFYAQYLKNDLVQDMQNTFAYKKYSNDVLKRFADTIMTYKLGNTYEQLDESVSVKNLDELVGSKNQEDKISENLTSLLGKFPVVVKAGDEVQDNVLEVVPGKILKIIYSAGGNVFSEYYYKVDKDNLESINVIPENKGFYTALNKDDINKNISFSNYKYSSDSKITKISKDSMYTIIATIYNVDDDYSEFGNIKYTTKDFKTFKPIAFKPFAENAKWKDIK